MLMLVAKARMAIRALGATLMKTRQPPVLLLPGIIEGLVISPRGPNSCTSHSAQNRWMDWV